MVRTPPWGMASRAFTTRFMSTCSICPGSALTVPPGEQHETQIRHLHRSGAATSCQAAHQIVQIDDPGCITCLRLKASN